MAGLCGTIVAAVGKIDIFVKLHVGWPHNSLLGCMLYMGASWLTTGILASGGSAFWNHALDLIKATKIKQEQSAKIAVADTEAKAAAAAVQL